MQVVTRRPSNFVKRDTLDFSVWTLKIVFQDTEWLRSAQRFG